MRDFCVLIMNGTLQIAVKRLKTMTAKAEMEFAVEVEVLGRVRHKNLLGLRGFYAGGEERLIVYDYMPNHSLLNHLHGQLATDSLLDWPRRMSIAIGAAEGLVYVFLSPLINLHLLSFYINQINIIISLSLYNKINAQTILYFFLLDGMYQVLEMACDS